jgi:hypothetical protein
MVRLPYCLNPQRYESKFLWRPALCLCALLSFAPNALMAQSNKTDAARWLANSELAPPFVMPATRTAWEKQRRQVRAQLWDLLGKLPPRPKRPKVETLSQEDRGGYVVEKFSFDNGAGATVPGYLLRPKDLPGKAPAILYCHWHGGEYDIGKEELFQAKHTPEAPGPALANRGFVVLGIDAYCFGERNGHGLGGARRKRRGGRDNRQQVQSLGRAHALGHDTAG